MVSFFLACGLAIVGLLALALLKVYSRVPVKELKRMARAGDAAAELFYKPVAYGVSLAIVLWLVAGLALAGAVLLFADTLPAWLAFIVVAVIVWAGFVWIPAGQLTKGGLQLAKFAAPPLAWLLERLQPLLSRITTFVRKHRPVTVHTGLYEKSDIADLLEKQRMQSDSRITEGELELLLHALSFGDKLVSDVLIPRRAVVAVSAGEMIGPSLMDELHKSGHSRFPVYQDKEDNLLGVLYFRDLVHMQKSGKVGDVMHRQITYVHEDFTLYQTLQAFIKTQQHLFIVVNSFEEFTGIITIEDVIEQIVGSLIVDEFDTYDDIRAVAATAAQKEHAKHKKTDSEVIEVIE